MCSLKRNALGKGLSALLEDNDAGKTIPQGELPAAGTVLMIHLDEIETNPFQPRNDFDETALQELADSIRLQGIIQPVTVRKAGDRLYQLISGERRMGAWRIAGLTELPAFVHFDDSRQS